MGYTKNRFFDEKGEPYSEVVLSQDDGYISWLDERQEEREAEENLEEMYNDLEKH